MLVCNEEKWVSYAINSVYSRVEKIIIFDTGSRDKTVNIIKKFRDKIIFEEKGAADAKTMIDLRNEQIKKTDTDWFMILDGDEAYPTRIFDKLPLDAEYWGVFLHNHLCVGDVYHALPESYGKYELCGRKGHLNLRFYRKMNGWKWWGKYPLEYYGDENGKSINKMCNKLYYLNDYYWHMSFLQRSNVGNKNHVKYHLGRRITGEIPEVFKNNILKKRSARFVARSLFETPIRYLKNL